MPHFDKRKGRREPKRDNPRSDAPPVDESSVIIQQFLGSQKTLDAKHDRHERLVKLSRDVTIESKRAIFLMQRISGDEEKKKILPEAIEKLSEIQKTRWRPIAKELDGEDPYQFLRAYSPGLQEYIEALSFHHFLNTGDLISLEDVEKTLVFARTDPEENTEEITDQDPPMEVDQSKSDPAIQLDSTEKISVHVPPIEYMLGIADLTGEVMRMAIRSVSSGKREEPKHLCDFLRTVHDYFLLFGNLSREINRKVFTLKQSLQKVEAVCYTVQVRGSEIPKHMLAEVLQTVGTSSYEEQTIENV